MCLRGGIGLQCACEAAGTVERRLPRDARAVADADDDGEHEGDDGIVGDDGADEDGHKVDCEEEGELAVRGDHRHDLGGDHASELGLSDGLADGKGQGDGEKDGAVDGGPSFLE